jgi:LPS sulfotransferase NodH
MGTRSGLAGPTLSYLICATLRSGSTLLCAALDDTGIAGHPEEHFEVLLETGQHRQPRDYFQRSNDPEVWALLDDAEFRDVLASMVAGTPSIRPGATPTGTRLTSRGWWKGR